MLVVGIATQSLTDYASKIGAKLVVTKLNIGETQHIVPIRATSHSLQGHT